MSAAIGFLWLFLPPSACPSPYDLIRFPPQAVAESWVAWQDGHVAYLEREAETAPAHLRSEYWDQVYDARFRRAAWQNLLWAWNCHANNNDYQASAHLRDLRLVIGDLNYVRGVMPVPCDVRKFQWRD